MSDENAKKFETIITAKQMQGLQKTCKTIALGFSQDSDTKLWQVVQLRFNPETDEAFVEKKFTYESFHTAEENFKIVHYDRDMLGPVLSGFHNGTLKS